jgi:PAP2 superfamily
MARTALRATVVALLLCSAATAEANGYDELSDRQWSYVASVWFDQLYQIVKAEGTAPPPASRIYGVTAVALYEAVVPGSIRNLSLVGQLNGLTGVPQPDPHRDYHWPAVANVAMAQTIRGLFASLTPASQAALDALEARFNDRFRARLGPREFERSVEQGHAVADGILAWAAGDGFAIFDNCPYVPAPVAGAWKPTPPNFVASPVQPCWGSLRPMALRDGAACPPPGHPAFSTDSGSDFAAAAREVYETGLDLTDEQKTIATFWADNPGATGTPPGHWIAIVGQLSRNDRLSLMAAAEAYARVGIAVTDAFICCWNAKYATNLQRPVTYIVENIDPGWMSFLVTPAFPAYTSGHSSQSGAAAFVLTDLFGRKRFRDTIREDQELVPPLAPRTFESFSAAAAEAALSRLYGGIHYWFDNDHGLEAGRCVGHSITRNLRFKKYAGS